MARKIVFVQPGQTGTTTRRALSLSRLQRVWSYHSLALCRPASLTTSSGFSGSSIRLELGRRQPQDQEAGRSDTAARSRACRSSRKLMVSHSLVACQT
jgi:hypothetical protein